MSGTTVENERDFRNWLKNQFYSDGMRIYTDNEISAYSYALKTACDKAGSGQAKSFFYITDYVEFEKEVASLKLLPDFNDNDRANHGTLTAATNLYAYYLEHGPRSTAPEEHAAFYIAEESEKEGGKSSRGEEFYYHEVPMKPIQKVLYGAPGTGKSYRVRKFLEGEFHSDEELRAHTKRVIFHPTYSYGEFVGAIKPMIEQERPLDYLFVAGPFCTLLKSAFLYPEEKFYLIIEEINRGNAPAIFGDIFQLLDRQENGKSEYTIINRDIGAFFSRDPWMKNIFFDGRIWLPANFNIIATMNTADDNIFVMDSAFKRRFELEYVPIDFSILPDTMKMERAIFYGTKSLEEMFLGKNMPRVLLQNGLKRNWPTFAAMVNHAIDVENLEAKKAGRTHDKLIAENKKLGPFFIKEEELSDRKLFLNKVVFYLKQDVFCDSFRFLTDSFEDIYEKYIDGDADIFELLLKY